MIRLRIGVEDSTQLIADYGAGSLIRWESKLGVGAWIEGGTIPLVAATTTYTTRDTDGTDGTLYRARYSTAAPGTDDDYSAYSAIIEAVTSTPYLTPDEFREHVTTSLGDDALQRLLDAAEEAIIGVIGTGGSATEDFEVHGERLMLSHRASTITSVTERTDPWATGTALAANDYGLSSSGWTLRRLSSGTNPGYYWAYRTTVVYEPVSDAAERRRVQMELVRLELAFTPGLVSQTIGGWAETYSGDYSAQRQAILGSLNPDGVLMV
jgi:hypothetical protein